MQKDSEALNTPAMKQFLEIKSRYPDGILFFRMGDFYEMFLDDAIIASSILDIALTKRQNQIPMCGLPYHAADNYISRLLSAGKKIVICEQKKTDGNTKLLSREVVRVVSPGTVIEDNLLSGYQNNFLCAIFFSTKYNFLALADISTSELEYIKIHSDNIIKLKSYIFKFSPKEIVILNSQKNIWDINFPNEMAMVSILNDPILEKDSLENMNDFTLIEKILKAYLNFNYQNIDFTFNNPKFMDETETLEIDEDTVRNLNLVEGQNEKDHSLFSILNKCKTQKGKRVLKKKILFPTRSLNLIHDQWKKIQKFEQNKRVKNEIKNLLSEISDLERILSRFRGQKALPRDFRTIIQNIETGFLISKNLNEIDYPFQFPVSNLDKLKNYIQERLHEGEIPVVLGNGIFLKSGFNEKLDKSREAKTKGKDWIIELEEKEKISTGLSTLKIRYNKIVGYFVELSRAQGMSAPKKYLKKQTLVTSERFTFPELEEIERTILSADTDIQEIEKEEFDRMVTKVLSESHSILSLSEELGELDYTLSLSLCKDEYRWIRPEVNDQGKLSITNSRHPVVENYLPIGEKFISNDLDLDREKNAIAILTGPNMAGKSTFMRQIAINQILFQIGSYVAASNANLSIVDKLFTRIGSGDNLTEGESTFFLEMKETAYILNNKTSESLILFDEVGRGTSTYDGLSIAWSILEFLSKNKINEVRTKTIFATHYHELTELDREEGIFNLYLDTTDKDNEVIFLKKVKKGKAKKSFGIYVAKIAGIPLEIIERARDILIGLESKKREIKFHSTTEQLLFPTKNDDQNPSTKEILKTLEQLNLNETTPLDSMKILEKLVRLSKE
ncbi:MAG: DNA mismatch repair protein MutS [Leptospiraceae bacterium]|nr:DNA mismatch repair protein MutS [Leptospiraceae bacterium]MCK6380745.1 DNA mismatch repair protein MutS [Leptospiraceae bacterium]NUM40275.1 DNA mismatch repair protein MutS [Leptospiraceae bacterium]